MARLRLAESLTAVFYLPHLVAQACGAFRDENLTVEVVTSFGQQWALLERRDVDLAIGGPPRNMDLYARTGEAIINFCGALRANTWFLMSRGPARDFTWSDLVGRTVIGLADAPQGICLRWLLLQNGIDPGGVTIVSGNDVTHELAMFRGGAGEYLLHSLHSAASLLLSREAVPVQELATPTGPVPWSTYSALPDVLRDRRGELRAFTRAIARALQWIAQQPPSAIAELLAPHFPDWRPAHLSHVIGTYKQLGTWAHEPLIPRNDWNRYCAMYVAVGALSKHIAYDALVDVTFTGSP